MAEESFTRKLFEVMALNGAISKEAIRLMDGGTNSKYASLSRMRRNGWIVTMNGFTRFNFNDISQAILNKRLKRELQDICRDTVKNSYKKDKARIARLKNQSEAFVMVKEAMIEVVLSEDKIDSRVAQYLDSRMAKAGSNADAVKAYSRSRHCGVIYGQSRNLYVMYVVDNGTMLWEKNAEIAAKQNAEERYNSITGIKTSAKAVILTGDVGSIKLYLQDGLFRTQNGQVSERQFISAVGIYNDMLVIPKNNDGKMLLSLITMQNYEKVLNEVVLNISGDVRGIVADKEDYEDGITRYSLNFVNPNINRLRSFLIAAQMNPNYRFCIHCLEEYREGVESVIESGNVEIVTHTMDEIVDGLALKIA